MKKLNHDQSGYSTSEVLIGMFIMAVMAMGMIKSSLLSLQIRGDDMRKSHATTIANEVLETFHSKDPKTLSDSDDFTDTYTYNGIPFSRIVDVIDNGDTSKTIIVTVASLSNAFASNINYSLTLSEWRNK